MAGAGARARGRQEVAACSLSRPSPRVDLRCERLTCQLPLWEHARDLGKRWLADGYSRQGD
jgi:hypothetical protein